MTTTRLVRGLVEAQPPELAFSTLELVDEGWDNATFRLGTDLAVRPPRRKLAAWLHGDLHSRNVILRDGALTGLIDWGDITAGDPATDLACAWTLMEAEARAVFWETYGADEDERARAAGWAVNLATAMVDAGDTRHVRIGRAVIERLSG